MIEKYVIIPKLSDHLFKSYDKKVISNDISKNLTIDDYQLNLIFKNDLIIILRQNHDEYCSNPDFWTLDNLKTLEDSLFKIESSNEDISYFIGIHWGGSGYPEYTKDIVDETNRLKGGKSFLSYYSETDDEIHKWDETTFNIIKEKIEERVGYKFRIKNDLIKLKDELIKTYLPLAIDIQGLSEIVKSDLKKGGKYYNEIRRELVNVENKETEYCTSLKIFPKDFPDWKIIKNKYQKKYKTFFPSKIVNTMLKSPDLSKSFIKNYLKEPDSQNPSNFFPLWLKEVIDTIDKLTQDANASSDK